MRASRRSHEGDKVMTRPQRIDAYPRSWIGGYAVRPGRVLPFGASRVPGGINFSVYSASATAMTLVLYRRGEQQVAATLPFPSCYRIGAVYAMTVFGLDAETTEYGYLADGPASSAAGHRFDPDAVLLDPYATLLTGRDSWNGEPHRYRCAIADDDFDWEDDRPLNLAAEELVIYEVHVRGFTRHASSAVHYPGTYAGLAEKIGYLRDLGVNCLELMPVFEFDELDNPHYDPQSGECRVNFWGYNPVGFFAPKAGYAATGRYGMQADEFKHMVKQLHRAGIEVILDVVLNHTGEGNELGPTLSFRGLDNSTYYMLAPGGEYYNFSGTGNTLNCNHPVVRGFILDCLRYWASEYHIDGFRFDLAAVLGRATDGSVSANPPVLESLARDPVLRDCKLIAEAWDAAGLYQVGAFHDYLRWSEWNGRFRDTVRGFVKGDTGMAAELARRLSGSPDLYGPGSPTASVNFITAHDGFTLADLVSYNGKHNEANGEGGRDGDNANSSWNCGVEGPTADPAIRSLRERQVRNLLLLLLCSWGIPMLLGGDEAGRTQHGNNNAYCHDGTLTWFDWDRAAEHAGLFRFTRCAIAFRREHPALRRARCPADQDDGWFPPVSWHGTQAWAPDLGPHSRLLAVMFYQRVGTGHDCVYLVANAYWEPLIVELPALSDGMAWHQFADSAATPPGDAAEPGQEPPLADQASLRVAERSVVVLVAHHRPSQQRG
jgi:isoamylase